jgi:hypothetical protein
MKKPLKISLIVVGAIVALFVIIALIISPIAKWYIEKNSKELVGRVITMDDLHVNIFTGSLEIVKFDLKEQDENTSFFKFDTLDVKVKLFDFLRNKVTVQKVHLTNFNVNLWQNGEVFSFDDIIQKFSTPDTIPADTTASPWEVGIYDIQLRNGNIHYKDLAINGKWNIKDFTLNIPGVYFSGKTTDIGFDLNFTDGGRLASTLKYDIEKSLFDLHIDLERFTLAGVLPYMQQSMRVNSLNGLLETHLDITGDLNHIMNLLVKGTVAVTDFDLRDEQNELLLSANRIFADIASIDLQHSKYALNEVSTEGLSTRYIMLKDSTDNFTRLMKETEPAAADTTASEPMQLTIAKLDITGTNIHIEDRALQFPFQYDLKDVSLTAEDFNPDKNNKIKIRGRVGSTGRAMINWNGNFNDFSNLNLRIELQHISLKDFTPYSLEYTAYPISNGLLKVSSSNVIKNNMLKGVNGLNIYKCNVEKARKDIKPVMKVPLRTALYILKDRNEEIKIDLPIEGNINSPTFSYKKIIIQTLTNLLVKVATAPFDALARTMGFNAEQLEVIPIDATQYEFTSVQYDKFSQLAKVLESKPELQLTMQQYIDYQKAIKDYSMRLLKVDYVSASQPQGTDMGTVMGIVGKVSDTDNGLAMFTDSKLSTPVEGDIYAKALILHGEQAKQKVSDLAAKRNQLIVEYMTGLNIPATSLKIETMPTDTTYTGYKTGLDMPE